MSSTGLRAGIASLACEIDLSATLGEPTLGRTSPGGGTALRSVNMLVSGRVALGFLLLAFVPLTGSAYAKQPITLQFDYSAADEVIAALNSPASTIDITMPNIQAVISKDRQSYPGNTRDVFFKDAKSLSRGGILAVDHFALGDIKKSSEDQRLLLNNIRSHEAVLRKRVIDRLLAFKPDRQPLTVRVAFVEGGHSDGWTDGKGVFYIDLAFKKDDLDGLAVLMTHELYHVVQSQVQPFADMFGGADRGPSTFRHDTVPTECQASGTLLLALMNEGFATYVGDALGLPGSGPYLSWYRKKYRRNLARVDNEFFLFDSLLYRVMGSSADSGSSATAILFSGDWDSPGYFVGYTMVKTVDQYEGRAALLALLSRSPASLYLEYDRLSRQHSRDKGIPKLDRAVVDRVTGLKCLSSTRLV